MNTVISINGKTTISGPCQVTGKHYSVTVPTGEYEAYKVYNEFIQVAMPNVPAPDREFIVSGTSPEGWELLFADLDDQEDYED